MFPEEKKSYECKENGMQSSTLTLKVDFLLVSSLHPRLCHSFLAGQTDHNLPTFTSSTSTFAGTDRSFLSVWSRAKAATELGGDVALTTASGCHAEFCGLKTVLYLFVCVLMERISKAFTSELDRGSVFVPYVFDSTLCGPRWGKKADP